MARVIIGMDPHKRSATIEVMDGRERVLAQGRYGTDSSGYRAMLAGWERWYVPEAVVVHDYAAVIDRSFLSRHTLWHARGMARFVRKHPERLLAL